MEYKDYLNSVQKEKEDQVYLEFNRRKGIKLQPGHVRVMEGVIVIAAIAALVAATVWVILC